MRLVYLATAWVAGIWVARAMEPPWYVLVAVGTGALLAAIITRKRPRISLAGACVVTAALGAARLSLALPRITTGSLAAFNDGGLVTLDGVVIAEPEERDGYTSLRLRVRSLIAPDGSVAAVEGRALARVPRYPRREYGDRLLVEGLLETPPSDGPFSYRDYLARQGIHSVVRRADTTLVAKRQVRGLGFWVPRLKRHLCASLGRLLPEPEASLLMGILLGDESGIPQPLMDDFAATGTIHIIAISGFNLTVVASVFAGAARRLIGRRHAFFVAAAAIVAYTALVGAGASVARAALMAFLVLWARHLGRLSSAPVALAAAAVSLTAWNPFELWDVGFQLSFLATMGLIAYAEPFEGWVSRALGQALSPDWARRLVGLLGEGLVATLAATIWVEPLIVYYFGQLSLTTLLSNALVLPAQPYVMIWGGLAALCGLVARPLAQAAGWVAWAFLAYTIGAVRVMASMPGGSVPLHFSGGAIGIYYGLLACVTAWFQLTSERRAGIRAWLAARGWASLFGAAGLVVVVLGGAWFRARPDGALHVVFLDVGQGDAIFVQTPSGRQILIDGGPSERVLLDRLGKRMAFWDRSIDMVLLTHPDLDHITGLLPVLERYRVDRIVYRDVDASASEYERWTELVVAEDADVYVGASGLEVELDEGVRLTVLHPGADLGDRRGTGHNNASVVARLEYGSVSVLLTGDMEADVERRLLADGVPVRSTVLKLAHHGSCTSTSAAFLEAVAPDLAVISVGENDFGHPCDVVLARLEAWADDMGRDLPLFRTDQDGAIEVVTDGARVWATTER